MRHAKEDAIFMHCLPAHRNQEVTDEVMDSKSSVVWQQSLNRMYVQQSLLNYFDMKEIEAKKKKAALRMRNPAKLHILARKKAMQMMRDKFYPGYKNMALAQRVKVDQVIMQKYGKGELLIKMQDPNNNIKSIESGDTDSLPVKLTPTVGQM